MKLTMQVVLINSTKEQVIEPGVEVDLGDELSLTRYTNIVRGATKTMAAAHTMGIGVGTDVTFRPLAA